MNACTCGDSEGEHLDEPDEKGKRPCRAPGRGKGGVCPCGNFQHAEPGA